LNFPYNLQISVFFLLPKQLQINMLYEQEIFLKAEFKIMMKRILVAAFSWMLFTNVAEASPIRPELDAALCYMRWPGLIDLSYTLCGASRSGTPLSTTQFSRFPLIPTLNPVNKNPFVYGSPVGPGATEIKPLVQGGNPYGMGATLLKMVTVNMNGSGIAPGGCVANGLPKENLVEGRFGFCELFM
jgi:hypothetical protein